MEDMYKETYRERDGEIPCSLYASFLLNLHVLPTQSSLNPVPLGFYEGFITKARLIKPLADGDWSQLPGPAPMHHAPTSSGPCTHLGSLQKLAHWHNTRHHYHLGIHWGFRISVPGTEMRPNIYSSLLITISHRRIPKLQYFKYKRSYSQCGCHICLKAKGRMETRG